MAERNPFEDDVNPFDDDAPAPAPAPAGLPAAAPAPAPAPSSGGWAASSDASGAPDAIFAPSAADTSAPNVFASPKHDAARFAPEPVPSPVVPATNPFSEEPAAPPGGTAAPAAPATDELAVNKAAKNWPRCYPVLRLAIEQDIPLAHQATVRLAYAGYLLGLTAALVNCLVYVVLIARKGSDSDGDSSNTGNAIGLVATPGYVLLEAVVGWWVLKYLYNGTAMDRGRAYCCYFCCGGARVGFLALAVVGITGTYLCGIVLLVDVVTAWEGEGDKITVAVACGFWCLALAVNLLAFWRANAAYRGKGQEGLKEMKHEATRTAAEGLLTHAMDP